jgi:hypothetical protein
MTIFMRFCELLLISLKMGNSCLPVNPSNLSKVMGMGHYVLSAGEGENLDGER